jgi:putative spermidine/putrescine transport system ATP-binding protein
VSADAMARPGKDDAARGGSLSLRHVTKDFDDVRAADDVSLDIASGEFVTLLGPSGSGKTTLLRMIAGFVAPDAGSIALDGRDLTRVPAHKRDIGMVFQSYALFPHLTAARNVAFPLRRRGVPRGECERLVRAALDLVRLDGLGTRFPRQLSGGQQQRVALARAVVFQPRLLLMDEPLGALDRRLREALALEIVRISRRLRMTVVYVTHDQEEALVMSDRIAVLERGRILQVGTSRDLYESPASLFVAGFIGESNVFHGVLSSGPHGPFIDSEHGPMPVSTVACAAEGVTFGSPVTVVVRPERVRLSPPGVAAGSIPSSERGTLLAGVLKEAAYLGPVRRYLVTLPNGQVLRAVVQAGQLHDGLPVGARVDVTWRAEDGVVIDARAGADS